MEEYLRLLITARKAFRDIDPRVKIANRGIPSRLWGLLITKELLIQGKDFLFPSIFYWGVKFPLL